jgi:prolyl-tRNA editing enzyme YbaK/EbsC (Cys-tRNA(Pro) deacylase)
VDGAFHDEFPKPIGGVPPFGHSTQLRVFVDPDLLQYDEVWAVTGPSKKA